MTVVPAVAGLIDELNEYALSYPAEAGQAAVFIDFLRRNGERCFDRNLAEGHVTASCWLLNPDSRCVLLTHHRKLNAWLQLGGHADGEADPRRVALAEAREESGIDTVELDADQTLFDIDRHLIPARANEPEHFHYDFRFVLRAGSEEFVVSDESNALRWCDIGGLASFTEDESVLRMGRKWVDRNTANKL